MKYLIVNADDFGASCGINRGVMEAHERGILTSASLLVDAQGAKEAAALCGTAPNLSVGLHVDVRKELEAPAVDAYRLSPQRTPRPAGLAAFPRNGAGVWNAAARTLTGALLLEILRSMGRADTPGTNQCGEPRADAADGDPRQRERAELSSRPRRCGIRDGVQSRARGGVAHVVRSACSRSAGRTRVSAHQLSPSSPFADQ